MIMEKLERKKKINVTDKTRVYNIKSRLEDGEKLQENKIGYSGGYVLWQKLEKAKNAPGS